MNEVTEKQAISALVDTQLILFSILFKYLPNSDEMKILFKMGMEATQKKQKENPFLEKHLNDIFEVINGNYDNMPNLYLVGGASDPNLNKDDD